MPLYMVSFYDGDMQFSMEDLPAVAAASNAVVDEAIAAGVWVFGGGFMGYAASWVQADGTETPAPTRAAAPVGGFSIINVDTHEQAVYWASRIADGCRCPQELREFMPGARY